MKARKLVLIVLAGAYLLMWIGGVGHYTIMGGPPLGAPWAASLFLLLAGALILVTSRRRELIGLSVAALIGFAAEVLGVEYGWIFSPYRYTETLRPQVLGVPLVMLSAWMVLVSYAGQTWMRTKLRRRYQILLAAVWMTAIDLVIDPLAANQLGYWRWVETGAYYGIPAHNFAGWFVVSLLIFSLTVGLAGGEWRQAESNPWANYVGLSIVLFFTSIALSYGLVLAGGIGLCLCLIHLFVSRRVPASN